MNFYEQLLCRGRTTGEGMTHFERLFAKKFSGGGGEIREYTGAVPVTITADGTPLLDYLISGNTVQNGTPTPTNPVDVVGVGERTRNLYDKSTYPALLGYSDNDGMWRVNTPSFCSIIMPCEPNTTYIVSKMITNRQRLSTYSSYPQNGDIALQVEKDGDTGSYSDITTHADARWLAIMLWFDNGSLGWKNKTDEIVDTVQVEVGVSKPTAYEPYGYKLPIETAEDILVNNLTTQEYNGLTLTRNADGSVRVQGTATANSSFHLYNDSHSAILSSYQIIDNGTYYIGGGIEGNEEGKFYLSARYDDAEGGTPAQTLRIPYGENIRLDNSAGAYKYLSVYISVWSGITVDFTCNPYLKAVSATNNIYLGNVQTTRYVRKSVLDGTENWEIRQEGTNNAFFMLLTGNSAINHHCACTHYLQANVATTNTNVGSDITTQGHIRIRPSNASSMSVSDFKSFLADQYAAGTPVTVWYVLAESEIGIVNEPLMKIGDYADTVSKAQAGVVIPTNNGSTTIDVDTTLKPSEVYIKYIVS